MKPSAGYYKVDFDFANSMLSKSHLWLATAISGTLVLLSACSFDDETSSSPSSKTKTATYDSKSTDYSKDTDRLLLGPPQLSLKEGIKKYAAAEKPNMSARENSQRLTLAAKQAADIGDFESAEILLNEAIRLDDQNGEAYYQRGRARCNAVLGKDSAAIEDLKTAIKLGRGGARAHLCLARLYDANNQPQKAIVELGSASKLAPGEKDIYKARAAIYVALGQKDKALKDYEKLTQLHPKNASPYFRIAQLLDSMKRHDEAIIAYRKVLSLEDSGRVPLKPLCYKRLALIDSARGKHKQAIVSLTETMKLDKTDDEPLRLRALEYTKLKDYEKALADLNDAIELSPDTRENFESRADLYDRLGKSGLAQRDRIEAKRLNSKPAERPIYEWKGSTNTD